MWLAHALTLVRDQTCPRQLGGWRGSPCSLTHTAPSAFIRYVPGEYHPSQCLRKGSSRLPLPGGVEHASSAQSRVAHHVGGGLTHTRNGRLHQLRQAGAGLSRPNHTMLHSKV